MSYHSSACGRNEGHHCNGRSDIQSPHQQAPLVHKTVNCSSGQDVAASAALQASSPSHSHMHACTPTIHHTLAPTKHAPKGILNGSYKKHVYKNKQHISDQFNPFICCSYNVLSMYEGKSYQCTASHRMMSEKAIGFNTIERRRSLSDFSFAANHDHWFPRGTI